MDSGLIISLLTGALLSVAYAQNRQYYFVSNSLTWTDAQSHCRQVYTDLATIESESDVSAVFSTTSNYAGKAWIGLHDDLIDSWRWSLNDSSFYGEGETEFRNWDIGRPNNRGGQQYCVELQVVHSGTWVDTDCFNLRHFVCYNGTVNGTLSFVKVETLLSWTDAQIFCRENYIDLVSIRNQTENDIINSTANGDNVWIGLYREKEWSDGSTSLFRNWAPGQPNSGDERCVTTSFNHSGQWFDDDCSLSLPYICSTKSGFRKTNQNESSITLQWNKVNNNISFIFQFNGTETNITAPVGDGPVTHTVSSLTAGTTYTFTLFSVYENVRSSGVTITAVTAPVNTDNFRSTNQDESSITLQWNKVNNNVSFILQFNGAETNIAAPVGDGPVTHTVSSLTAATTYTFTVFSVYENVRSSGLNITVVTGPHYIVGLNVKLKSLTQLSVLEMEDILVEFLRQHGLPPELFSLEVQSVET